VITSQGIAGEPVQAIADDGIAALTSDVPNSRSGADARS